MSSLKEIWEFHVLSGEKVLIPGVPRAILATQFQGFKKRTQEMYKNFGFMEMFEEIQGKSLRTKSTKEGVEVWMEPKVSIEFKILGKDSE